MTQSNTLNEAASAASLAAITAGAVAAALPIMSVGFMMAIISLGTISDGGMPAAKTGIHHHARARTVAQLSPQIDKAHMVKLKQGKANYLMDAVLREDEHSSAPATADRKAPPKPAPISSVTHVFA